MSEKHIQTDNKTVDPFQFKSLRENNHQAKNTNNIYNNSFTRKQNVRNSLSVDKLGGDEEVQDNDKNFDFSQIQFDNQNNKSYQSVDNKRPNKSDFFTYGKQNNNTNENDKKTGLNEEISFEEAQSSKHNQNTNKNQNTKSIEHQDNSSHDQQHPQQQKKYFAKLQDKSENKNENLPQSKDLESGEQSQVSQQPNNFIRKKVSRQKTSYKTRSSQRRSSKIIDIKKQKLSVDQYQLKNQYSQQVSTRQSQMQIKGSPGQSLQQPKEYESFDFNTFTLQIKLKTFIKKLYKRTESYKFKFLSERLKTMGNLRGIYIDSGSDIQSNTTYSQLEVCIDKTIDIIFKRFINVFSPDNKLVTVINGLVFFFIIIELWNVPLRFSFESNEINFYVLPYYQILGYIVLSVKVLLGINTGIFQKGIITMQRKEIILHYLNGHFLVDIICIFSLIFQNYILSIFFIFQYPSLIKIYQTFDMTFQVSTKYTNITQFSKLIFLILSVAHICACGFLFIPRHDPEKDNSWLVSAEIENKSWEEKYLYAFYYMVITMSTIGYGDISPVTVQEKIYGIIISFLACGVFAFAVNMIGTIFQQRAERTADYNKQRLQALKFMQVRNISQQGQTKVLKYLEYQWNYQNTEGNLQQGQEVIKSISKNIQEEVYKEFYYPILKKCEIISIYFSNSFIQKLSLLMQETNIGEGENINAQKKEEEEEDRNLYYVIKGSLELYDQQSDKVKGKIEHGNFFGYENFFLNNHQKDEEIRSQGFSQILYIKRSDFLFLLSKFPREYENYIIVQNRLMLVEGTIRQCIFCSTHSHNTKYCPLVHFVPYKQKIKQQINMSYQKTQQRERYFREAKKVKYNTQVTSAYLGKAEYRISAIDIRRDLIFNIGKEYQYFEHIFDEINEDDDEAFVKLTPSIEFSFLKEKFNIVTIQPLSEFLEQAQNITNDEDEQIEMDLNKNKNSMSISNLTEMVMAENLGMDDQIPYLDQNIQQAASNVSFNNESGGGGASHLRHLKNLQKKSNLKKLLGGKGKNTKNVSEHAQIIQHLVKEQVTKVRYQNTLQIANVNNQEQVQNLKRKSLANKGNVEPQTFVEQYYQDIEDEKERKQLFKINDFENGCEFTYFFPWNNPLKVLQQYTKYKLSSRRKQGLKGNQKVQNNIFSDQVMNQIIQSQQKLLTQRQKLEQQKKEKQEKKEQLKQEKIKNLFQMQKNSLKQGKKAITLNLPQTKQQKADQKQIQSIQIKVPTQENIKNSIQQHPPDTSSPNTKQPLVQKNSNNIETSIMNNNNPSLQQSLHNQSYSSIDQNNSSVQHLNQLHNKLK